MRPQLRIIALLLAIALGFLFLSSFTGFFTAGGSSWEGKLSVTVAAEQQQITQHIIFSNHKSQNCADGIFVETSDGTPVTFSTFNEVHNVQGFCTETNVRFDNIIYQTGPQPAEPKTPFSIITGAQATNSITYEVYYGKISAAVEPVQEPRLQPTIEQPRVADYGIGEGGGGDVPLGGDAQNITNCTNITTNGTYGVNQSISSLGTCININASSVLLDCQNYNIIYGSGGDNYNYGVNISSNQALSNITVRNCNINKNSSSGSAGFGIYLYNASTSLLKNNTISTNGTSYNYGIYLAYSYPSNNVTLNNISTSGVSGDGYDYGIYLYNSSSNTVTSNSISTNGVRYNYGIYLNSNSNSNDINLNTIYTNGTYAGNFGINIEQSNSTISNNIISTTGGGSSGIYLWYSSSNVSSNKISAVGSGIEMGFSYSCNVYSNNISTMWSYNHGLYVSTLSNANNFTNNNISTFLGSGSNGIMISGSSSNNNFTNCDVQNVTSWPFYSTSSSINNMAKNLYIGNPTIVTFTSKDIALKNATAPAADPSGYRNVSRYVNATNNSANSWLFLNVSYDAAPGLLESSLGMAKYNATVPNWWTDPDTFTNGVHGVEMTADYVYANITNFGSIFAPLSDLADIDVCMLIDSPGYYKLVENITNYTVSTCIEITSSDVIFDGQGHTITGNDTLGSYGIYVYNSSGTLTNVTVNNVTVTDWLEGIYYTDVQNSSITNTVTSSNGVGILLHLSDYNTIENNTAVSNVGGITCSVVGYPSNHNTLINNNVSSNNQTGISIGFGDYNNLTNNTANSNGWRGIWLSAANDTIVDSNTANSNSQYGIYLVSSNNSALTSNNASSNTDYGIWLYASSVNNNITNNTAVLNSYGIYISSASNDNNFTDNTANSNTNDGIYLSSSSNNILTNNTASSNSVQDIQLSNAPDNTFINQTVASYPTTISFTSSGSIDIKGVTSPPDDPGSYYNISRYVDATNNSADSWLYLNISYEDSDLGAVDEGTLFTAKYSYAGLGDWVLDPDTFTDGTHGVNIGENYVYANITDFGSVFAPLGEIGCRNITSDGYYGMTQNITGVQLGRNVCIDIQVDNVIFDCAGYGLTHDDTGGTIGILANGRSNVTIENCIITDYESGIYLGTGATTNSLVENNTVSSNAYGISLSASSSNNITNNNANSNTNTGIYINSSSNSNDITNNTADSNTNGIYLISSSSYNNITKNTANSNTYGIYLIGFSNYNNITNNTANSNSQYGVALSAARYNNLTANKLSSNSQRGISIIGSSRNNTVYNNTLTNNNVNVYLDLSNAQYNNISRNTISSGTKSIYLYTLGLGTDNTIEYNTISGTTRGIDLYGSGEVVSIREYVRHNTISGCNYGIYLENIANNMFLNNTILASGVTALSANYDIYFKNARNNTFINTSIGSSGNYSTTISFTEWANGADNNITLIEVASPPADPSNYTNISKYVVATSGGSGNWLYLNVSYNATDLGGVDEGLLAMARNNGSWETNTSKFAGTRGVNTSANYVYANITNFGSTFAPLGGSGGIPSLSACKNITDAGYWILTENINDSTADCCINITVSDVTFDGQGYAVDGDGLTGYRGVCVFNETTTLTNVTVKNVTVTDWTERGISYSGVQNGSIEDNTARNNTYDGIYFESSSNNNITNNNVTNNYYGINLKGDTSYINISNNSANNNLYGAMIEGSYNVLINNTANNNYYDGGWGDGGWGIVLSGSNNNLTNNTANSNDYVGLGISAPWNNIINNTVNNNNQYGFYITSSENTLTDNTAENNVWDFYSEWSSVNNVVTNLEIGSTTVSFDSKDIALRNGTSPGGEPLTAIGKYVNATNNSADSWLYLNVSYVDPDDLGGVVESSLRMSKYNGSWYTDPAAFTDGTHDVNLGENYVYANITNFGSTFAPLGTSGGGGATSVNNCTTIDSSGSYALSQNIINSSAECCINITSSDVIFNGQSYTIDGVSTVGTNGVCVHNYTDTLTNVTAKNLTVTDWSAGVYYFDAQNSSLENVNANSNTYGLVLQESSYNNITSSTTNSNSDTGMYLTSSENNTVSGSTASSNVVNDIMLESCLSNTFTNQLVASYPTTVSFTARAPGTITLKGVTSPPADPGNYINIGKYVNISKSGGGSNWLYLNVSYAHGDIGSLNESSLKIAKNNASGWFTDPSTFTDGTFGVNTGANYVYAKITNFGSDFAPLGLPPSSEGNVNISIEPMLSITFIDNLVDFGTGFVTAGNAYADVDSNDTTTGTAGNWTSTAAGARGWPGNTNYMFLENNGNVNANVNITASDAAATFIGGTGPDQWYAAADNESVSCDGILQSSYTALSTSQTSICTSLRNNDTTDALNIMFKIRVPSDAPVSAKTNTITLSAVEA